MDAAIEARPELSQLKQAIVDRIAEGETIRKISKDPGFPSRVTVFRWQLIDPLFSEAITHAQRCAGAAFADEAIEVARNSQKDTWGADRVTVDTLKWAASKFYPKMFGSQDAPRTHTQVNVGEIKVMVTPEQRQAMIKARAELLGDVASDDGMPENVNSESMDAEVTDATPGERDNGTVD